MYRKPDWAIEGRGWPNSDSSRFVDAANLRWHVQIMGAGPPVLQLHGTGAATHSWRAFAPILAQRYTIIAPDLPGHGFTGTPAGSQLTLPAMAAAVGGLLRALDATPRFIVGHSAGAAIAARMALDHHAEPKVIVGINSAMLPFPGVAAHVFPGAARLLFLNPLAVHAFARRARDPSRIERLMRGTGSVIDDAGLALYARLLRTPGHVAGALGMMAHWDLTALARDLPALRTPLVLLVGEKDRAVPPADAPKIQQLVPGARIVSLPGLGHLAHEESPNRVAAAVENALENASV